jgi:membrane-associated phospholipid phosphatase
MTGARLRLSLLLFCSLFSPAFSQTVSPSPYVLNWKTDVPFSVIGTSTTITSLILQKNLKPLTPSQLANLDRTQVPAFDRGATYNWSHGYATASDVLMYSSFAAPFTLLSAEQVRKDFGKLSLITAEVFLINIGLTNLLKQTVKRNRPYTYNPNVPEHVKLEKDARNSYFSGHTSVTASMYFMTATMYADYFPDSNWKPVVWSVSAIIPAITGIFRVKAGKHFWTDVLTGYAVGALVGILVPRLHHRKFGFNQ